MTLALRLNLFFAQTLTHTHTFSLSLSHTHTDGESKRLLLQRKYKSCVEGGKISHGGGKETSLILTGI